MPTVGFILLLAFTFDIFFAPSVVVSKSFSSTWINLKPQAIPVSSSNSNNGSRSKVMPRIPRMMDIADRSRSNYTITFVPLISIIANYLPKFLKRLRTQEITSARSLNWLLTNEVICTIDRLGRFPNPDNPCQFFECAMNLKTIANCSYISDEMKHTSGVEFNYNKPMKDAIQLRSQIVIDEKGSATSIAVMYKVDECVSLILHQCSPNHIYSNRLQKCFPYENTLCPD